MGFFDMFRAPKIIEKGVDAVISAGDKLVYTDEEKADMKLKLNDQHIRLLDASHPFKVAQRILAAWFSLLFGIAFLVGLAMSVINIKIKYDAELEGVTPILLDIEPLYALVSAFSLGIIMITIVAFYFGGGTINSLKGK